MLAYLNHTLHHALFDIVHIGVCYALLHLVIVLCSVARGSVHRTLLSLLYNILRNLVRQVFRGQPEVIND